MYPLHFAKAMFFAGGFRITESEAAAISSDAGRDVGAELVAMSHQCYHDRNPDEFMQRIRDRLVPSAGLSLNHRGQCCGRKPIPYKRTGRHFCDRCDREYSMQTGRQVANWGWLDAGGGTFLRAWEPSAAVQAQMAISKAAEVLA